MRRTSLILGTAVLALLAGHFAIAADKPEASTGKGALKGGSDYESRLEQAGMSGMSGMSGMHGMEAASKPAAKKAAAKKAAKKKADANEAPAK